MTDMPGLRGFELAEDDLPDCRSTAGERATTFGAFMQTYQQSSQNNLYARAQQAAMPSVGFVSGRSASRIGVATEERNNTDGLRVGRALE
jgi:hypothetical protein